MLRSRKVAKLVWRVLLKRTTAPVSIGALSNVRTFTLCQSRSIHYRRKEWKVLFVVQFSLLLWNYFVSFLVCFLVQRISKKLHAYIGDTVISWRLIFLAFSRFCFLIHSPWAVLNAFDRAMHTALADSSFLKAKTWHCSSPSQSAMKENIDSSRTSVEQKAMSYSA